MMYSDIPYDGLVGIRDERHQEILPELCMVGGEISFIRLLFSFAVKTQCKIC